MTTLDNDFIRLHMFSGRQDLRLKDIGLEWPPPEKIRVGPGGKITATDEDGTLTLYRMRCSELDDDVADHPNLARGAEYAYGSEVFRDNDAA